MTTSHDDSFPHIGPAGFPQPSAAALADLSERERQANEPPPPSDEPGIRIDDLLELATLDDKASSVWTLVHHQLDGWGDGRKTVDAAYIVCRNSDGSLWAASCELVAGLHTGD